MGNLKINGKDYDKIEHLNGLQFNLATGILGKVDLHPIFLVIQTATAGHDDVTNRILGNGFLDKAITDFLQLNCEANLLTEIASLMVFKKGKYPSSSDDYEEYREEIKKDLLWENHEITLDLVGFFLEKSGLQAKITKTFSDLVVQTEMM
jgi:hypothetical protein